MRETGVRDTAQEAVQTSREILALFEADREKLAGLGRSSASALRLHQLLQRMPVLTAPGMAEALSLTPPTVRSALRALTRLGIVEELTGKRRDRVYAYGPYLRILNEGAETSG